MIGHLIDVNSQAIQSTDFRRVLDTGEFTQVVIMSINPGEDIGSEIHADTDQVLYLVKGEGKVVLNKEEAPFKVGDVVLVHAGTEHNFITTGSEPMKIITMYSPPHHPPETIHETKEEAQEAKY
ncbi:MAG: cupin domain-containing protein [Microgenomates group bacterium]|jgi:mannose-6-phosphate isomerase-like protein (cupin superfamily)